MQNLRRKARKSKQLDGREQAAALYGGVTLHGESQSAIDRPAELSKWRRLWRIIIRSLTPVQRRALELEMSEADR